jgi:ubiquinone/menaquinone biosynthesis C-methylase UbiE
MSPDHRHPPGAGRSSFELLDAEQLFARLNMQPGCIIVDVGCGEGRYALPLARRLGATGTLYALDLWEEGLTALAARARQEGLHNLRVIHQDAGHPWPLPADSVDLVLMATVLHDLVEAGTAPGALRETARCLKPGGRLVLVEFKKIPGPPGPPLAVRLAPEDAAALARPFGFHATPAIDLGPYLYLATLVKNPQKGAETRKP